MLDVWDMILYNSRMIFKPTQVLFAPTYHCNLHCVHCCVPRHEKKLPIKQALYFLRQCVSAGVQEVGFTGGEPFLFPEFLAALSQEADKLKCRFDRITTNAGWFHTKAELTSTISLILNSGFKGTFCVSVDRFHKVPLRKIGTFINTAVEFTGRPDIISLVYVENKEKIISLAKMLKGSIARNRRLVIRPATGFIGLSAKISGISLCPVEKAYRLKNPWSRKWFSEDFCQGPGQVLYVTPAGEVKPCCGFANDLPSMTIGTVYNEPLQTILHRAQKNKFLQFVFKKGLLVLKDVFEEHYKEKVRPTSDHCFLCWYLQKKGVRAIL